MTEQNHGEGNIAKLLAHAAEPPRMAAASRERILEALQARRRTMKSRQGEDRALRSNRRVLAGIALAATLVLFLAFGRERSVHHTNDSAAPIAIALEDGTNVVLDKGGELIERGDRHLRLVRGQAFLDVAHIGAPFVIDAPQGRVVVTGTLLVLDAQNDETRA